METLTLGNESGRKEERKKIGCDEKCKVRKQRGRKDRREGKKG